MSMFLFEEQGKPTMFVGGDAITPQQAARYEDEARAAGHPTERLLLVPKDLGTRATVAFMGDCDDVLGAPAAGVARQISPLDAA